MPKTYRKRLGRLIAAFVALFILLFLFRLAYGYYGANTRNGDSEGSYDYFSQLTTLRKNYASEKIANIINQNENPTTSQKYEKTATVSSTSGKFESDEAQIRSLTTKFEGSIQYEKSLGTKGSRELHLSIGVKPASFDSFYRAVQTIGLLRSTTITKVDKTNEYRQLNAKKATLEKSLASLNELKNKGGAISDFVTLHDKILEVESQLQELGVDLGNFNTENEFCTLRFSLFEGRERVAISFYQRVKTALEWTIKYYAISIIALAGILICSFILLLIADKLKLLSAVFTGLKN